MPVDAVYSNKKCCLRINSTSWQMFSRREEGATQNILINFKPEHKRDREGLFFVLSGPSGVGKNTLLSTALKQVKDVYYLPSITTRPMRPGETQGFPYFFETKDVFEKMITAGVFLEYKQIHTGDYYGTHLPTIIYAMKNGYDIITDMDVLGCAEVMSRFPGNVISIFITPPDLEELRRRLEKRESDPAVIENRLKRVAMEMTYAKKYRHVIINDELERASIELVEIIRQYL